MMQKPSLHGMRARTQITHFWTGSSKESLPQAPKGSGDKGDAKLILDGLSVTAADQLRLQLLRWQRPR